MSTTGQSGGPASEETASHRAAVQRPTKKRHHFVPITYLNGFTDARGRLQVYRCDQNGPPLALSPNNIAFQNYYYSQPEPDGGRDDHLIEDLFSAEVESHWPDAREAARTDALTPISWSRLYLMLASLRARVPATREMVESSLAATVRETARRLDREGRLVPMPMGIEDAWSKIDVAIDPHQSLHAIPHILQSVNLIQEAVGFEVLHNRTGRPFITSDNPVAWFDPRVPEQRRQPYRIDRSDLGAELIFPIDSWTLLRGTSALRRRYGDRPTSRSVTDEGVVRRLNRVTAQYAYRLMFAQDRSSDRLAKLYAPTSPILRSERQPVAGDLICMKLVFGSRPSLPKWRD